MKTSIYSRHRFHPNIIKRAVWLYFRFNLSFRDVEGTVLEVLVQRSKNRKVALRLLRKLLRNQGFRPEKIVTDKLHSYGAALEHLGLQHLQDVGGRKNNRVECSHVPTRRRERKAQKFRSIKSAQRLLSTHSQIYNSFNFRRHLKVLTSKIQKHRPKPMGYHHGIRVRLEIPNRPKPNLFH